MIIALWLLLLGFTTWSAQLWLKSQADTLIPRSIQGLDNRLAVQLQADRLGHYQVIGQVNGHDVVFLVDTGASSVTLPESIANQLGLNKGLAYRVATANGDTVVYATLLSELAIGQLSLKNVRATINPSMDGQIGLLGMTFLSQFELIQKAGRLTIQEAGPI